MSSYYYAINSQQEGPIDEDVLRNLYNNNNLDNSTLIWTDGLSDWTALKDTTIGQKLINESIELSIPNLPPPPPPPRPPSTVIEKREAEVISNEDVSLSVNIKYVDTNTYESQIEESIVANSTPNDLSNDLIDENIDLNDNITSTIDDVILDDEEEDNPSISLDSQDVWVPDEEDVWVKAKIINYSPSTNTYKVSNTKTSKVIEINESKQPVYKVNPQSTSDITNLLYIHEPGILFNLTDRFMNQLPYTFMSSILIAVNPLRQLPIPDMNIYVKNDTNSSNSNEPHPYAIAETAYQQLYFTKLNQSIIISGESGAGKTETAKILLKYLVNRSITNNQSNNMNSLDIRLLQSSPILESFGNSKTIKNNNSSRFGKFLKLLYDLSNDRLIGAVVETYLLEKSRVVKIANNERNYHIFYQLLSYITTYFTNQSFNSNFLTNFYDIYQKLPLNHPKLFNILNQSNCYVINDNLNETKQFEEILSSLSTVGFNNNDISNICIILYGILILGNLTFNQIDSEEGLVSDIDLSNELLIILSNILGIPINDFKSLLLERKVFTRNEWFVKRLSVLSSFYLRDAIIKYLYDILFQYIVKQINNNLLSTNNQANQITNQFIGILDIFGFENFSINQLEQLLINYANEVIQNIFNYQIFNNELTLYQSEGLLDLNYNVDNIPNNNQCIDLISNNKLSIFNILDNICKQSKPNDSRFIDELHKQYYNKHINYSNVHPKDKYNTFVIKHYAGLVRYTLTNSTNNDENIDSNSWIAKNNDSYPDDLIILCMNSSNKLLNNIISNTISNNNINISNNNIKSLNKSTLSSIFLKSMIELNQLLNITTCQFIRCIKPNKDMIVDKYNNLYITEQLRSLGILVTCEVLKVGYPTRLLFKQLVKLLDNIIKPLKYLFQSIGYNELFMISCILQAYHIPSHGYKLGKTMIFFKSDYIIQLNSLLYNNNHNINDKIRYIQSIIEKYQSINIEKERLNNLYNNISSLSNDVVDKHKKLIDRYVEISKNYRDNNKKYKQAFQNISNKIDVINKLKSNISTNITSGKLSSNLTNKFTSFVNTYDEISLSNSQLINLYNGITNDSKYKTYIDVLHHIDKTIISNILINSNKLSNINDNINSYLSRYMINEIETLIDEFNSIYNQLDGYIKQRDEIITTVKDDNQINDNSNEFEEFVSLSKSIDKQLDKLTNDMILLDNEINQNLSIIKPSSAAIKSNKVKFNDEILEDDVEIKALRQELYDIKQEITRLKLIQPFENKPTNLVKSTKARRASVTTTTGPSTIKPFAELTDESTKKTKKPSGATVNNSNDNALPDGWKELIDKKSGKPYFVNKLTKERQWKRPITSVLPEEFDDNDNIDIIPDRHSRRLTADEAITLSKSLSKPMKPIKKATSVTNKSTNKLTREMLIEKLKLSIQTASEQLTVTNRLTLTQFMKASSIVKSGYLMKQSKLLGRWKRRYFVLDKNILTYYDSSEYKIDGKSIELQGNSMITYTSKENCFCIKIIEDAELGNKAIDDWYLLANSNKEMEEWIMMINAHIHEEYIIGNNIQSIDYFNEGDIQTNFWKIPIPTSGINRLPVSIKSLPYIDAPNTGEGLNPGETVEIVQSIHKDDNTFLRLADDRGWIFEKHPKSKYALIQPFPGDFIEIEKDITYDNAIHVYTGPSIDSEEITTSFTLGTILNIISVFTYEDKSISFVKLKDFKGWINLPDRNNII